MANEKNINETKFQQTEPAELEESSLLSVAGGALPATNRTNCAINGPTSCQKFE